MTRRGWLLACSGGLFAASVPVAWFGLQKRRNKAPTLNVSAEEELIRLTNAARADKQLRPLNVDPSLGAVARAHSKQMALDKTLEKPDQAWLEKQLQDAGYNYMMWGLAIDRIYNLSLPDAFANWTQAEEPSAEVLNAYYADMGAGVFEEGSSGAIFATLVFGKRKMR